MSVRWGLNLQCKQIEVCLPNKEFTVREGGTQHICEGKPSASALASGVPMLNFVVLPMQVFHHTLSETYKTASGTSMTDTPLKILMSLTM